MPALVLLAGPNGAGKTTFIDRFLRQRAEPFVFVNPDEVARDFVIPGRDPGTGVGPERDLAAGRRVLERLDALIAARADIVLETTLATRAHARRLKACRAAGYRIALIYLRLPDAEASIARVRRRVERGGHGIPEATLRRRFPLSLNYLETVYKPLVDAWEVYASSDEGLVLLEMSPR
jgi:predicted ABC-type ATPase